MINDFVIYLIFIVLIAFSIHIFMVWWAIKNIRLFWKTKKITAPLFFSSLFALFVIFTWSNSLLGWLFK